MESLVPLPVQYEPFLLDRELDTQLASLAHTLVKEPADTKEAAGKVNEVRSKLKEKYSHPNIEGILTEKHVIR